LRPSRHARSPDASPLALLGCVLGLALIFFVPVSTMLFGSGAVRLLGSVAYGAMVRTYAPMARYLGAGFVWALMLPLAAALYAGMTISSAWRHHTGAGATWKDRVYRASE
jgi:hypothetical protein